MEFKRINNVLLALIIAINGYVIAAPLWPGISYKAQSHSQRPRLQAKLRPAMSAPPKPQGNRLVVPAMLLDQPVLEGPVAQQYKVLDRGIWRWPKGSTPDQAGNTVLIGHRFTYTNPRGVFYFLNKVRLGDEIGLWWSGREYLYKVSSIRQVPPSDTAIEDPADQPQLTLFTCTPLWLPKNRLVVVAKLETQP